eukprot:gene16390-18027_t
MLCSQEEAFTHVVVIDNTEMVQDPQLSIEKKVEAVDRNVTNAKEENENPEDNIALTSTTKRALSNGCRNVSLFEERFHKFGSKDEKKLTFPEYFTDSAETPVHSTQADLDDVLEEDRRAEPVGVNYEDRFLEEVRNLTGKRN